MLLFKLLATAGLISSAQAWGDLGHKTVANVALQFLPEHVISHLNDILAADPNKTTANPTIVDVASWADDFDHTDAGNYSKPYHYIDANDDPPFWCNVSLKRDCADGSCVVGAIANYTQQLIERSGDPGDFANALKFVVHFLGDVTQPLHAEAYEEGGNNITILWNGAKKSLHSIWDTAMITKLAGPDNQTSLDSWTGIITNEIVNGSYKALIPEWTACTDVIEATHCAKQWARDSNSFVCSYVLATDPAGKELSGQYYQGAAPIIQQQIAKAGVRLAVWLNQIFGHGRKHPYFGDRYNLENLDPDVLKVEAEKSHAEF